VQKYDQEGPTILARNPGFYAAKADVEQSESLVSELRCKRRAQEQQPRLRRQSCRRPIALARQVRRTSRSSRVRVRGADFGCNSSPKKRRTASSRSHARDALSHAFDASRSRSRFFTRPRDARANVADPISDALHEKNNRPAEEKYDLALPTEGSTKLGYKRGGRHPPHAPSPNCHRVLRRARQRPAGINREVASVRDSFQTGRPGFK